MKAATMRTPEPSERTFDDIKAMGGLSADPAVQAAVASVRAADERLEAARVTLENREICIFYDDHRT